VGSGKKTMLFPVGGPGNLLPRGAAASGFLRAVRPFTDEYTIYLVSRKSGLPAGYSTRNMSDDYADLIREEFGGHVHLLLGHSFGGLILQHFAADHADLVDHIVIAGAAHRITDAAKRIDLRYAQLVNQGRDREAMAQRAEAVIARGPLRYLLHGVLWALGKRLLGPINETFRRDVLIEAEAELSHDATDSLARITVPVLIVCAAHDFAFRLEDVREMAALIRRSELKVYDRGHATVFLEPRFASDVRAFTNPLALAP